jgi:flagellar motor switch protein FliN/FliY
MALSPQQSAVAQWAIEAFATGFAAAVEGMAGARPGVSSEIVASLPELTEPVFRWRQPLSGAPGEAFAVASESDMLAVGQHVMLAAGIEDASAEERKSTFRESLNQAFSVLTQAMTTRLQQEITPATGAEAQATPSDLIWGVIRLTLGDQAASVFLGLLPQLLDALSIEPKTQAQAAGASVDSAPPAAPAPQNAPAVRAVEDSKTFDLLLDVELPVSVSFGHALVPLKDVLKLTTGSIVELSRAVVEPVDIVVNNCIIAKGEVVVVEGNFGVRIQQVVSRSERLRSLQ